MVAFVFATLLVPFMRNVAAPKFRRRPRTEGYIRFASKAVAAAEPSSSNAASVGLPVRGAGTLAGRTFLPVIIGHSRF